MEKRRQLQALDLREIEARSGAPNKTQTKKHRDRNPNSWRNQGPVGREKENRIPADDFKIQTFWGKFGKPETVHLLKRGDAEQPQEEVTPTVLKDR